MVFKLLNLNINQSDMDNLSEFIEQLKRNQKAFSNRLSKVEDFGINVSKSVLRDLIQDARELHEGSVVLSYILFNEDPKKKPEQLEISLLENQDSQQSLDASINNNITEEDGLIDALDEAMEYTKKEIQAESIVSEITEEIEKSENEVVNNDQERSKVALKEEIPNQEVLNSELEDEISSVISSFSSGNDFASVPDSPEVVEVPKPELTEKVIESNQWKSSDIEEDNSLAAQLAKQRIESLISAIGINEKFLFTNELFDGNTEQFLQVIDDLNNCKSFEDAKSKLDALAQKRNWEQEEEPFQKLQSLLSRKHQ